MTKTSPTRVFLVDDQPVVREGFRKMLEGDERFTVAGEAGTGEEALEQLPETEADLATVDISMEGIGGIELTRRITLTRRLAEDGVAREGLQVLIVSMHRELHYVKAAFEAGARGYILKANAHPLLLEAAQVVLEGRLYGDPDLEERPGL